MIGWICQENLKNDPDVLKYELEENDTTIRYVMAHELTSKILKRRRVII